MTLQTRQLSRVPISGRSRVSVARGPVRVEGFALPKPPVEEGPGTGRRHYPDALHQQYDLRRRAENERFDMMSTEECYKLFPLVTHSSTPLHIEDHEPAGLSAQRVADAGPATGCRRRPAPADSSTMARRQLLPYPGTRPTDLRRELIARHAPEVLLAQQQEQLRKRHLDA